LKIISLITVCFNAKKNIKKTLESVRFSKEKFIEFIVIDGGSTDGTLEIIEEYKNIIDILISEPDHGTYDAINKGIKCSSGKIIGLLHAGTILKPDTLKKVFSIYNLNQKNSIIAGSAVFSEKKPFLKLLRSKIKPLGAKNTQILHETLYIPKKYYNLYGLYDLSFPMSADYSWMCKAIKSGALVEYTDFIFIDYCEGWGASADAKNFFQKMSDHFRVMKREVNLIFAIKRYIIKVIFFCLSKLKYYYLKFQNQR
jgi:glycosyltransferase involved in cell wall biosynthesis